MLGNTTHDASSYTPHCEECPLRPTVADNRMPGANWRPCRCKYHAICQHCGWPITDDAVRSDHHSLCAMCAWEDLTQGRPPEDRHELPTLLAALGLPRDTPVTFHLLRGTELDDDWGDYRVEWAMIPDVAWQYLHFPTGLRAPWRVQRPGWEAPRVILRWRQWRVGAAGTAETPDFLERSWLREGSAWSPREQVRAVNRLPSRRTVEEFTRLLDEHSGLGRRPDDLDRWLETEVRPAIARIIAAGRRPDQNAVAEQLGLTLSGLGKKLSQLNAQRRSGGRQPIRWRQLVAEV